jgi:hypothetical protein
VGVWLAVRHKWETPIALRQQLVRVARCDRRVDHCNQLMDCLCCIHAAIDGREHLNMLVSCAASWPKTQAPCVKCLTLGPQTIWQCTAQFIVHEEMTDAPPSIVLAAIAAVADVVAITVAWSMSAFGEAENCGQGAATRGCGNDVRNVKGSIPKLV